MQVFNKKITVVILRSFTYATPFEKYTFLYWNWVNFRIGHKFWGYTDTFVLTEINKNIIKT